MSGPPWSLVADGIVLSVRVTPKAGRDSIENVETLGDGRAVLKVKVRAAPSEGEATSALIKVLAKALDVAPSRIDVVAGATARIKRLAIAGDGPTLIARLEKICK